MTLGGVLFYLACGVLFFGVLGLIEYAATRGHDDDEGVPCPVVPLELARRRRERGCGWHGSDAA